MNSIKLLSMIVLMVFVASCGGGGDSTGSSCSSSEPDDIAGLYRVSGITCNTDDLIGGVMCEDLIIMTLGSTMSIAQDGTRLTYNGSDITGTIDGCDNVTMVIPSIYPNVSPDSCTGTYQGSSVTFECSSLAGTAVVWGFRLDRQ
jgi:hypothetical protein